MKRLFGIAILLSLSLNTLAQDSDRPKQPDLPGDLLLDFGFNVWSETPDLFPTKFMGSNSFGIYYNKRFRFSDYISFHPAAGFTVDKIAFEGTATWSRQDDGTVAIDSLVGVGIRKNKLVTNYFEIPVEFRIHPLGTVNGEGWFIGLGAVGGVRIGSNTKIKYDVSDDATIKEKLFDGFDQARFRYGVQARFGFKTVHLFYKMYFSDQFNNEPSPGAGNPRVMTFGINFSGF